MRTKHASQGRLLPSLATEAVVEVQLERVSIDTGPIVDVALVPAKAQLHKSFPKPHTKLERAIANKARRLEDAKQLRSWAHAVKERDQWKDRKTGVTVRSTPTLDPLRAESHHIVPKADRNVRYDIRNGICLSYAVHDQVERGVYRIDGTVFFWKNGSRYVNGNFPVYFVRL